MMATSKMTLIKLNSALDPCQSLDFFRLKIGFRIVSQLTVYKIRSF